jgi:threonine/homoserine/homoserine lactone efflux protein
MLIQGVLLGISLSFMVGPLLFAIVQAGIERGFRAGLAVAGGIWISDVLYVLIVFHAMDALITVTAIPNFKLWAGLSGGMLLVAFGMGSLFFSRTPMSGNQTEHISTLDEPIEGGAVRHRRTYAAYLLRGFLLNTVNPFTVFFWLGIAGGVLAPNGWSDRQVMIFFSGMLGTLVVTDTLKAYAAKRVRRFLTPEHTLWVQRGIGLLLVLFGAVLVFRVL